MDWIPLRLKRRFNQSGTVELLLFTLVPGIVIPADFADSFETEAANLLCDLAHRPPCTALFLALPEIVRIVKASLLFQAMYMGDRATIDKIEVC